MPSRDAPLTVIAMALHGPAPFAASHCLVHSCDTIATLPVAACALSPVASVLLRGDQAHRARVRTQGSALRCPLESSNGICTQTVALTVATAAGPHASIHARACTHRRLKRNRPHARTHAHMRAHTRTPAHTHRHRQVQPCEAADGEEAHDRIEANHGDGAAPWRRQSRTACNSHARNMQQPRTQHATDAHATMQQTRGMCECTCELCGGAGQVTGSADRRLCWFDMDLSTKPYRRPTRRYA